MEIGDYARIFRRNWLLILAFFLLGLGAAGAYCVVQPAQYQSTAKVFVSTQTASNVNDLTQGALYTQQAIKSYANVATAPIVLEPVIDRLGLDMTATELAEKVSCEVSLETVVLQITARDQSPAVAAGIANAISARLADVVDELTPTNQGEVSPVRITEIQGATAPLEPVTPNVRMALLVGAVAGLVIGCGLAVLRETTNTRIRGRRDIELATGQPVIGAIPFDPKAKTAPIATLGDRAGRFEAIESLSTNIEFSGTHSRPRSLVVTSPRDGVGKTTTVANLAVSMAATGATVVLVDADLRRSELRDLVPVGDGQGLAEVLAGRCSLQSALVWWPAGGVTVLHAGGPVGNPSALVRSDAMAQLMEELADRFETVIYDAPPLLPDSGAAILSRRTDGAILLCAAGRSRRAELTDALERLRMVNATVFGIVVTMLPKMGPDAVRRTASRQTKPRRVLDGPLVTE
jgi:polysaccharide biosynthesis transport protein